MTIKIGRQEGTKFCLYHCPEILKSNCIGTLNKPCPHLMRELKKTRSAARNKIKEKYKISVMTLHEIENSVPLSTSDIITKWHMSQEKIFTLIRWGILKTEKKGTGKGSLTIVGVSFEKLKR